MHTHRIYKKWLFLFVICVVGMMALGATFNYVIDPLWCFTHDHWFTSNQKAVDERQQKTNYLSYVNTRKYDALILGNSRTALTDQNDFSGLQAYNYSVAGMTPYEYLDYINYFKKVIGTPRNIIMGLDFQNTNQQLKASVRQPEYYIHNSQSALYRFKALFMRDTFSYSLDNLRLKKEVQVRKNGTSLIIYDHGNVATLVKFTNEQKRQDYINKEVDDLRKTYRNDYTYRDDLVKSLKEIKQSNPGTSFIAFTTPVSKLYFCAMVTEGKLPQYERWLREMVELFGQVWHFEYLNSITMEYDKNFSDSHHFYPPIGTMIAHRVTGMSDNKTPSDFGILLNAGNIDRELAKIKSDSAVCR